ncbi:hypothetical protein GMORB2_1710 [Geosmithia morbida]|uniref:Uncharacterized protein n=1 Tax=Geosmithia morbida TaxID=1094350 RepID=A0A9P4YTP2_9HYPO|nr:uncharacterized protein GMORB2_1710 [Geosmithia morbida]KAF4121870.1 hypothetical protein GMORB2_1710 [Geosmithia morbida]
MSSKPAFSTDSTTTTTAPTSINANVTDKANAAISYAQRSFDRVVPPPSRERAYSTASTYASERPIFFTLIVTLLVVSSFFTIAFAVFALSILSLALGAALLFSLFWMGVALAFIVPVLLAALLASVIVWAWLVGGFLVARWLYIRVPLVAGAATGRISGNSGTTDGQPAPKFTGGSF